MADQVSPSVSVTESTEKNFDDMVSAAVELVLKNPRQRALLYWTLERCKEDMVSLETLEDEIEKHPEFHKCNTPPYFIAQWLVEADTLDFFEIDAQGAPIDRVALENEGLSEDDIDDKIVGYAYATNAVGCCALERLDPTKRLKKTLSEKPAMRSALLELLAYLNEKHSLGDIAHHLKSVLGVKEKDFAYEGINPIALVSKLSDAGVIVFSDHGWQTTAAGKRFLLQDEDR